MINIISEITLDAEHTHICPLEAGTYVEHLWLTCPIHGLEYVINANTNTYILINPNNELVLSDDTKTWTKWPNESIDNALDLAYTLIDMPEYANHYLCKYTNPRLLDDIIEEFGQLRPDNCLEHTKPFKSIYIEINKEDILYGTD